MNKPNICHKCTAGLAMCNGCHRQPITVDDLDDLRERKDVSERKINPKIVKILRDAGYYDN